MSLDEDDLAQKEKDLEASQVLAWQTLRITRNGQLSATDWTQMPDAPLSNEDKMVWQKYRQELRDITNGLQNPSLVEWPNGPQL